MVKKTKKVTKPTAAQPAKDFQSIIVALQQYWMDWGCVLWQPYNEKVGAGTMNPATFLRVLGPEPWNVAYVEPSVRPDDGRYGENPNRLQQHTQFQVILKPDPGNPQELYLRSLQAIGIDVHKHDIRFVEDNWTSPALGAWGLGWEVWLDGLEITQYTYFQQAGGLTLDPVSVEITYGLDRIAMALQGVQTVAELRWDKPTRGGQHIWGDLNLQGEREHSKYYFETADVERVRKMAELYEEEAKAALSAGLLLPAYDYVLKTSHAFNVLDARGAIGVTERQGYFRRMRALANQVAEAYVADRQRQEFPWLQEGRGAAGKTVRNLAAKKLIGPKQAADFLLEIGTEEMPAADLDSAIEQLRVALTKLLSEQKLAHKEISVMGTPRRLVVKVTKLAPRQADRDNVVKGPPAARAFGADGTPTPAAVGFARGQGVPVSALKVEKMDGGEYVVARVHHKGLGAAEVLAAELPDLIAALKFEQSIRWNASAVTFPRPIRWLLALHGEVPVPFEYAGLQSGNTSRGLRLAKDETFKVASPTEYFAQLKKQGIFLDVAARRAAIEKQVAALAKSAGGSVPEDAELLSEVTNLVEAPTALLGEFDSAFLDLPREVLIAVMKKHQRYFPVEKNGKLLNKFIAVGNGIFDPKAVIAGNAGVIRARFADAAYFIKKDRETKFPDFVDKLKHLTFQKDLGSMADKTKRIVVLTKELSSQLGLSAEETKIAERAAQLCKADLVTKMVIEMTSLEGVMGKYYALDAGEPPAVAEAILEHYLPRFAGDATPKGKAGLAVGLADRMDTLTGLFALGLEPTGTKDPFAQRRAAIGLVQNLMAWNLDFDLRQGIAQAAAAQPVVVSEEAKAKTLEFLIQRQRALLLEGGTRHDVVDAVLLFQGRNPAGAAVSIKSLSKLIETHEWADFLNAYSRSARIIRQNERDLYIDINLISTDIERKLYTDALLSNNIKDQFLLNQIDFNSDSSLFEIKSNFLKENSNNPIDRNEVDKYLNQLRNYIAHSPSKNLNKVVFIYYCLAPMKENINSFFDKVLVMDENEKIRNNRLGLLKKIVSLAEEIVDFSKLEGF